VGRSLTCTQAKKIRTKGAAEGGTRGGGEKKKKIVQWGARKYRFVGKERKKGWGGGMGRLLDPEKGGGSKQTT